MLERLECGGVDRLSAERRGIRPSSFFFSRRLPPEPGLSSSSGGIAGGLLGMIESSGTPVGRPGEALVSGCSRFGVALLLSLGRRTNAPMDLAAVPSSDFLLF